MAEADPGWAVFAAEPALADWAARAGALAQDIVAGCLDPHQWRCGGTWFAGINLLPNDAQGACAARGLPPLPGAAIAAMRARHGDFALDRAQLSVIWPGYPRPGAEETAAAFRYRQRREAAHVDGLARAMPGRRRRLSEIHGFILGIPLGKYTAEQAPLVVWEGSQHIMRAAFRERLSGIDPARWPGEDLTEAYAAAREHCFRTCRRAVLSPGLGAAYVVDPLALHGVAAWSGAQAPPRAIAYFRPDVAPGAGPARWLA